MGKAALQHKHIELSNQIHGYQDMRSDLEVQRQGLESDAQKRWNMQSADFANKHRKYDGIRDKLSGQREQLDDYRGKLESMHGKLKGKDDLGLGMGSSFD